MLRVTEILPAGKLPKQLSMIWREIQITTPELKSPYFCIEYIQSVASARSDVWVAVLEDRQTIAGFFPFQRDPLGVGRPVGHIFAAAAGLIMSWAWGGTLELSQLFLILGSVSTLASLAFISARAPHFSLKFGRATRARYLNIWKAHSRWALLGVVLTQVTQRAYVFIIGAAFGTAAVGTLEAGRLMYQPLSLIVQAWARVAQPTFASLAAAGDFIKSNSLVRFSAAGVIAFGAIFMIALWVGWPFLQSQVFRGAYPDIGIVVTLWGLVSLIFLVDEVFSTQLVGMARFRELSFTSIFGSIATLSMFALVFALGSYLWSLGALAFGGIVELAFVLIILSRIQKPNKKN